MNRGKKIIVIGAGASGLMAAGRAAEKGADVLLLEKMKLPGRKIGISGKGRCNITNTASLNDFISHFGKNGCFLRQVFSRFFSDDLTSFFTFLGLDLVTERGGRIFPKCGKGVEVVKTLEKWVRNQGVSLLTSCSVTDLLLEEGYISHVVTEKTIYPCDAVILATGGASYPRTGSTGDGYDFAEKCGHTLTRLRPALIPIITKESPPSELNNLLLKNVKARLFVNGKKKLFLFGDIQFTQDGLSGPLILTMSEQIVQCIDNRKNVQLLIDIKPALTEQKLDNRLIRDFTKRHQEPLSQVLGGLLPRQIIPFCLEQTQIDGTVPAAKIQAKTRKSLTQWLKNVSFTVCGYGQLEHAIVTSGGVKLKEIEPESCKSKCIDNLYITGELLDLNGDTGGFNLQAAFSTGWVAGEAAATKLLD